MKSNWSHIIQPTLIVDELKVRRNIKAMADKAKAAGVVLQPHFKTHQSREIGEWYRDAGVSKITVSSVGMAEYFAVSGWEDITIAFPMNVRESKKINELAEKVELTLLTDNIQAVRILDKLITQPIKVYVEIDTGSARTGLAPENGEAIQELVSVIEASANFSFKGLYSHPGHTYNCRSMEEVVVTGGEALRKMEAAIMHLKDKPESVCFGDTPACTALSDFGSAVNTISPGNFVFYDVMQVQVGVCNEDDIAVYMVCPVVTGNNDRNEWTIYGGAVHFSKDRLDDQTFGISGRIEGSMTGKLIRVSQEHGIVKDAQESFEPGDLIKVYPVHSCLTAECMGKYLTTNGRYLDHYQKSR